MSGYVKGVGESDDVSVVGVEAGLDRGRVHGGWLRASSL